MNDVPDRTPDDDAPEDEASEGQVSEGGALGDAGPEAGGADATDKTTGTALGADDR